MTQIYSNNRRMSTPYKTNYYCILYLQFHPLHVVKHTIDKYFTQVRALVIAVVIFPMNTNYHNPTASTEEDWRARGATIRDHVIVNCSWSTCTESE